MRKLRWGLIGCGDISRKRVAPALRDSTICDFVAVNRARYELAEEFAREYGARKWHKTWQNLIQDPEIDAVYVSTPVYLHAPMTVAAAKAGKHVLCEKPMAMALSECDQMIKTCRNQNVQLGLAFYRHFFPLVKRIKQAIADGEIGKIVYAQFNVFSPFDRKSGEDRFWLMQKDKAGGGPMFDMGCHRIELVMNLFGEIQDVKGFPRNIVYEREVEDSCVAYFEMESGANVLLSITHAAAEFQDSIHIFGNQGSIHIKRLNTGEMLINRKGSEQHESHPPHANLHQPLIEDFTQSALEARAPIITGEIGRKVNEILMRIYGG
ncbi:Gfo/Idh/MocA family oxidoreductase [candidate division KSB1 bacterium]|nr:Gfo/Idh/MocA family oxidoreductase [candidate division KSB1 bacterium]